MDFRIIKAPTEGTYSMIERRVDPSVKPLVRQAEAIGLMQGKLSDMFFACDIAEKASGVHVTDVRGNCPQNLVMIAVFGDTSSVETAMETVARELRNQKNIFADR